MLAEEVVDVQAIFPQEVQGLWVVQVHGLADVDDPQLALHTQKVGEISTALSLTYVHLPYIPHVPALDSGLTTQPKAGEW